METQPENREDKASIDKVQEFLLELKTLAQEGKKAKESKAAATSA